MNDMINKSEFILGVDGGGTKTIARLENLHTGEQWLATGGSASLTNDFDLALQHCNALVATCVLKLIVAVLKLLPYLA